MPLPLNPSAPQIQFSGNNNTTKNPVALLFGWLALAVAPTHAVDAAEGVGSITGMVSNAATRNLLEGAKVEVPQLGLAALTDTAGRFVLSAVPAGAHELVVSYVGLDPARSQVTVAAGARVVRDFDLTAASTSSTRSRSLANARAVLPPSRRSATRPISRTSLRQIRSAICPT
jgi:hypothetical protein